jgi:hypothetical protein
LRQLLIYPEILATFRKRDIYQGGVFGDGEGGGSGDEEEKERDIIGRRFVIMKSLMAVLMGVAVLLVISSCATVTEGPEGSSISIGKIEPPSSADEFRLLSVDVPHSGNLSANVEYWTTINFVADRKPEILRACFNFSGDGQSCVDVQAKDVKYGSHTYFRVPIHVPVGSKRIDCYAEYIREGKTHRTNTVTYYVIVLKEPEE